MVITLSMKFENKLYENKYPTFCFTFEIAKQTFNNFFSSDACCYNL